MAKRKTTLELMDWKNIERGAKLQLQDALVSQHIALILLNLAEVMIRAEGGKTIEDEEQEAKRTKHKV